MQDQSGNSSSRPGIVIIAIVALLLVAGIAIWFTTNKPFVQETKSTTSSTTVRDIETPAPSSSNAGDNNSDAGTSTNGMNPPDSTTTP